MTEKDYLFRDDLASLDPDVAELIRHETARQARYLIMIPSESTIPAAVREAVASAFMNIYAEGYPNENTRWMSEEDILDYHARLPEYRRDADQRYYKGTEYANVLEALTRRRLAERFSTERAKADQLYVNVQPLSGAPANSAVYTALLQPGDVLMSMDLMLGGHLSHGAPVNRAGKTYQVISYGLDEHERIDYEQMRALAHEHRPKIIIGGYSSYPLAPDWDQYRAIADEVGAILLADVAHVAGMVATGVYPSPVGIADIVTFTTHKTLNGPRGAVILTHRKDLASKLDRGVFPGEQGGPHMNQVAGLAVALKLAQTEQFEQIQQRTADNAKTLAQRLQERGLRIPYGGTESHMLSVDCKSVVGPDGATLSGDMAARILDLVGVVCNRQTIPGDKSALRPSGIRLGTPWITQRGFGEAETIALADVIADVLQACVPFKLTGRKGDQARAKIDFDTLQNARLRVRELAMNAGIDTDAAIDGYPHFHDPDEDYGEGWRAIDLQGERVTDFLQMALTSDVARLAIGEQQPTKLLEPDGRVMASGALKRSAEKAYRLYLDVNVGRVVAWLRALSDGFVLFDPNDIYAKLPGPVDVVVSAESVDPATLAAADDAGYAIKTAFIGLTGAYYAGPQPESLPEFEPALPASNGLLTTPLTHMHKEMGARMGEFAGYEMPLWYDSVLNEHLAVRQKAGLFDVTHMGVWDAQGPGAQAFLDALTTNDVSRLKVGSSHYTFLLDVNGVPFDDLMIYRLADDHFFIVVNASNNDKNWQWVNAVREGRAMIDAGLPGRRVYGADAVVLRDLRAADAGMARRVDLALQGPESRDMLLQLAANPDEHDKIKKLPWAGITRVNVGGYDLIVTRTGYTGERIAYELFPHPDHAADLFKTLIQHGATPCGLASRDSLRIEAGLPLYGHELEGPLMLNPADAAMGNFVKLTKPFFVGKAAFIEHEKHRDAEVTRFRMANKGARPAHQGDPIVDGRGRVVGIVTSCSVDSEGYQLGHAYLKRDHKKAGTQLEVFAGSQRAKLKKPSESKLGERLTIPEPITILTRFPKR